MKLSNIFKKENKTVAKANVETLAKNQLAKVVGGAGETAVDSSTTKVVEKATSGLKDTLKTQV
jgi:hypothetical protein